jgi:hypothetical protein
MDLVTRGLAASLLIWFALLAMIIAGRVLGGDLNTTGILRTRHDSDIAPERALSMMLFPLVLLSYVYLALTTQLSATHPSLPDLPDNLLMALAGGNGLYLAGKIARTS